MYVKANSKDISGKMFTYFLGKMLMSSFFVRFFFLDSNSFCKDLFFAHGPNLAQKPPYLVGTVLKLLKLMNMQIRTVKNDMVLMNCHAACTLLPREILKSCERLLLRELTLKVLLDLEPYHTLKRCRFRATFCEAKSGVLKF